MLHVEFTIEPFVEGRPGPHVTAAIEAARRIANDLEIGPFGSSCSVPTDRLDALLAALGRSAFGGGATRLTIQIENTANGGAAGAEAGA